MLIDQIYFIYHEGGNIMMDTQFAKFLQIGIIVENVEETVKQYEKYGIGPWRISPLDSAEFPDFTMNGKKGTSSDRYGVL